MHVHMEFAQPVEREWTCRTSSIEEDLAVALETINSRRPDGMPPLNPSIGWKQKGPIAKTSDQPGEDDEDADTAVPISRHVEKFKACGKRCLGLIHVRNTLVLVVSGCYTANTLLLWLQAHVVAAHCAVRFRHAWPGVQHACVACMPGNMHLSHRHHGRPLRSFRSCHGRVRVGLSPIVWRPSPFVCVSASLVSCCGRLPGHVRYLRSLPPRVWSCRRRCFCSLSSGSILPRTLVAVKEYLLR